MSRGTAATVPGSPRSDESKPTSIPGPTRPRPGRSPHPAAALAVCAALGLGLSLTRAPAPLLAGAVLLLLATLRAERRPLRAEAPLLLLASIVFAAHLFLGGRPAGESFRPSSLIALRLLALIYLTRWSARTVLPPATRWLFGRRGPSRPRPAALLFESGRMTLALLPLALAEAERQHTALRARAIRPGRGPAGRARYLAAWLLPYLGTMLRMGDAYGEALHARGYTLGSPRRAATSFRWGWVEAGALSAGILVSAWLVRAR